MKTCSFLYPEQLLKRRTMAWAMKLRVNPTEVIIEAMPGKWGSCSPDKVLRFADDLVEQDQDFQDYVIVHELLHLRYKSHGKRFEAMMSALVPNWRAIEARSGHGGQRPSS